MLCSASRHFILKLAALLLDAPRCRHSALLLVCTRLSSRQPQKSLNCEDTFSRVWHKNVFPATLSLSAHGSDRKPMCLMWMFSGWVVIRLCLENQYRQQWTSNPYTKDPTHRWNILQYETFQALYKIWFSFIWHFGNSALSCVLHCQTTLNTLFPCRNL